MFYRAVASVMPLTRQGLAMSRTGLVGSSAVLDWSDAAVSEEIVTQKLIPPCPPAEGSLAPTWTLPPCP